MKSIALSLFLLMPCSACRGIAFGVEADGPAAAPGTVQAASQAMPPAEVTDDEQSCMHEAAPRPLL